MALYMVHDEYAQQEVADKAFLKNYARYDQDGSFLARIRHEALYACYVLTENEVCNDVNMITINTLQDLPESINQYNILETTVHILDLNIKMPYGYCLLNKWCGFNKILINKKIFKGESNFVCECIDEFYNRDTVKFHDVLTELNKNLLFFISMTNHSPTINVHEMMNMVDDETRTLFKKIPAKSPTIGYYLNDALIDRCIDRSDKNAQLYKLFTSGSRFSKTQFARSCMNIGFCADDLNQIVATPINGNLMEGITEAQFFLGSPGTRKAISDKSAATPDSGYLERTIVMAMSPLECVEDDCFTDTYLTIEVLNAKHVASLVGKYYRENENDDWIVFNSDTGMKYINKKIQLRSPMTCTTPKFRMCKKCFGTRPFPTNHLGITAGQNITERLTQLTMRTFHESGASKMDTKHTSDVIKYLKDNLIDINVIDDKICLSVIDGSKIPENIKTLDGFNNIDNNKIYFDFLSEPVKNEDSIETLTTIKGLLKTQYRNIKHPQEYYMEMMKEMLDVGTPYSSFIEMLFANMFMIDYKKKLFWRYNQEVKPTCKLGDKVLSSKLSALLGLLFTPNSRTIEDVGKIDELKHLNPTDLTIYEKIFLEMF